MFRISNIRIGTKLAVMTGTGIVLVAIMVATIILSGIQAQSASDASARRATIAIVAGEAKAAFGSMRLDAVYVRLTDNPEVLKANAASFNAQYAAFTGFVEQLLATAITVPTQERIKRLKANGDAYAAGASQIIAMKTEASELQAKANGRELAQADKTRIATIRDQSEEISRTKTVPAAKAAAEAVDELVADTKKTSKASQIVVVDTLKASETASLAIGIVTIVVLIATAVFGAVSIARPLRALTSPIAQLAEGNFVVVVPGLGRKDEVGQIAEAVSDMAKRVRASMVKIKESAAEVTNSAIEISGSTTDLSQRTEEQAASLEEIAASMEEISSQVKRNAESAQAANVSAAATRQMADTGGSVVAKTVDAMAKIEESSRKISDIIGVIDEIARQTNLLALNAAVEAARAGDAGRGFAVVASEVRSLAQRSSQAAKDITNLITTSNAQVKDGVDLVGLAGSTLLEIMGSLKEVATIVSDIASASAEQSTGVEEINKAITQMDEVTQQNSALVEENAATAKSLEHQAQAMDQEVAYFQIEADNAGHDIASGKKAAGASGLHVAPPAARAA